VKERGWDGNDDTDEAQLQWSFAGALLYAVTVTTTIGESSAHWRRLANTIDRSVRGGDAALWEAQLPWLFVGALLYAVTATVIALFLPRDIVLALYYTLCHEKRPPFYFSNNSVKN